MADVDVNSFGNFKRKVRNTINKLESAGLIIKKQAGKADYAINLAFERTPSLWDGE